MNPLGTYFLSALMAIYPYLAVGIILLILYFLTKNPDSKYAKYKGYLIKGILLAEKFIPDDTDNKSLKKADLALKIFQDEYEKHEGKPLKDSLYNWANRIKEEIILDLKGKG